MLLSELLNNVETIQVLGQPEKYYISGITHDSREVGKGFVFVAIEGYKFDGHKFIEQALASGASAIILQNNDLLPDEMFIATGVVKILVANSRRALSQISYEFYDRPSHKLKLIGITGTKGKTTTSFLIKHLLEHAGHKVGLIGTIANYIGNEKVSTKLTTPESVHLHALMNEMVKADCEYCVMEVSSHALVLNRVDSLKFDTALFTNITSDHFDFHENFESYLNAKKMLFDMLPARSVAVVNIDDLNWPKIIRDSAAHCVFYGVDPSSLFMLNDINYDVNGTSFKMNFGDENYNISLNLIGKFNAYNAAAATAVVKQMNVSWNSIIDAFKTFQQVPGRFEVIERKNKKVIIDYSHTADSLQKALEALNNLNKDNRKIYTVFGCGGDRDKTKRPQMGKIAEEGSNYVIVTSDNPRTENPAAIIKDITKGMKKKKYKIIENRDEAIKDVILNSENDAIILIAGKGHEDYQEINGVRYPFSDKLKAEEYLELCKD